MWYPVFMHKAQKKRRDERKAAAQGEGGYHECKMDDFEWCHYLSCAIFQYYTDCCPRDCQYFKRVGVKEKLWL